MNGPIFSGGEEFIRLWSELPKVVRYREYIEMCNEIDSARMSKLITESDEKILMDSLEAIRTHKGIEREEY